MTKNTPGTHPRINMRYDFFQPSETFKKYPKAVNQLTDDTSHVGFLLHAKPW